MDVQNATRMISHVKNARKVLLFGKHNALAAAVPAIDAL